MIEGKYRTTFQRYCVNSWLPFFARIPFCTPQRITFLAGVCGLAACLALREKKITLAILLVLLSGYLDIVDGQLARLQGSASPLGSILDILCDRLVEFLIVLGLFFVDPSRALWCLLMLGAILLCVSSFLVVGIFSENQSEKSFHYSEGLIERAEAFVFFIAMMLFPSYFNPLAAIFTLLVLLTTGVRVHEFWRQHSLRLNVN